jgi:hypothetical protein
MEEALEKEEKRGSTEENSEERRLGIVVGVR